MQTNSAAGTRNDWREIPLTDDTDPASLPLGVLDVILSRKESSHPQGWAASTVRPMNEIVKEMILNLKKPLLENLTDYLEEHFSTSALAIKQLILKDPLLVELAQSLKDLTYLCSSVWQDQQTAQSLTHYYEILYSALSNRFNQALMSQGAVEEKDKITWFCFLDKAGWESFVKEKSVIPLDQMPDIPPFFMQCHDFFKKDSPFPDFQPFLAARYLAENGKVDFENLKPILEGAKNNPRYRVVLVLLAGLLKKEPTVLNQFLQLLDKDETSFYSTQVKMRCLEESGWPDPFKEKWGKEIRYWCYQLLNPMAWKCIQDEAIKTFSVCPIAYETFLLPCILEGLQHRDFQVRVQSLYAFIQIPYKDMQLYRKKITQALMDPQPSVRLIGVFGVTKIPYPDFCPIEKKLPYTDPHSEVRKAVAWCLGQQGTCLQRIATPILLNSVLGPLLNLLMDEDPLVGKEALLMLLPLRRELVRDNIFFLKRKFNKLENSDKKQLIFELLASLNKQKKWVKSILEEHSCNLDFSPLLTKSKSRMNWLVFLLNWFKESPQIRQKLVDPIVIIGKLDPVDTFSHIAGLPSCVELVQILDLISQGTDNQEIKDSAMSRLQFLASNSQDIKYLNFRPLPGIYLEKISSALVHKEMEIRKEAVRLLSHFPSLGLVYKYLQIAIHDIPEVKQCAIEVVGKLGKEDLKLAYLLIAPIARNFKNSSELLECLKCLELLGDASAISDATTLADFFLERIEEFSRNDSNENFEKAERNQILQALIITLGSMRTRVQKLSVLLQAIFLKRKENKLANLDEASVKACDYILAGELTKEDCALVSCYLSMRIQLGSPAEIIRTLELLKKMKPLNEVLVLLEMVLNQPHDDPKVLKNAILTLHAIQAPLKETIHILKKFFYTPHKREVHFVLSHFDLSDYPNEIIQMLENCDPFTLEQDLLANTPLDRLITLYLSSNKESYLPAIAHKCLSSHIVIFASGQDLFFYDAGGKIHQFPNHSKKVSWIHQSIRRYQNDLITYRACELEKNRHFATAGDYFKKNRYFQKMFAAYVCGSQEIDDEEAVSATFSLGQCYGTGLGIPKEQMMGRLEKAVECYFKGNKLHHPPSQYFYAISLKYGLGIEKNVEKAKIIFEVHKDSPLIIHLFNSSIYAYLIDKEGYIPPGQTIALALVSLEEGTFDREKILAAIKNKKPLYDILSLPHVRLESGDLYIRLPAELAQNQKLIKKWEALGLKGKSIAPKKIPPSPKTYVMEFIVDEFRIAEFLEAKLGLSEKIYFELMENKRRS